MSSSISVNAETRVFPASRPAEERTVPLSILDATVANFAPTETVLAYDAPAPAPQALLEGLRRVLDWFPQWSGRLHCLPFDAASRRHGRLALTWGGQNDPGVAFVEARCDMSLAEAAPLRSPGDLEWDPSAFPAAQLVPQTPLAAPFSSDADTAVPRPALLAQLTTFTCGGLAVGLRFAHPLADAHALAHFLRDWAAACRNLPPPSPGPLFDPALLDARAAPAPADAPPLPCNRFDWWVSNAGSPFPPVQPPPELRDAGPLLDAPGTPMPWADWDVAAPVSHRVLRFRRLELQRLWEAASTSEAEDDGTATATATATSSRISRLDALLGHLWACINRARGLEDEEEEEVTLDYTLGVRPRVAPALPDRFVGSPLIIAAARSPARDVMTAGAAARLLRAVVGAFTPTAVAGHLHEKLHAQSPQRLWQAFLGRRHLLVTSWIRTRLYEVDFVGAGVGPRLVHAAMPRMDGLVQLMEAPPVVGQQASGHWADDGVDVQLYLEVGTMERLLRDPELRGYAV
ncbi:hypothetical protein SLS57_009258 [Botryosphaeria dothidea]